MKNLSACKGITRVFLAIILFSFADCAKTQTRYMDITYKPIGYFHTEFSPENPAPRQGILDPSNRGVLQILEPYREALYGLDQYESIVILYHLDRVTGWEVYAHPPGSDPGEKFGLFSTRSPRRPNPIGLAVAKLEKMENGLLYLRGVDAFDGTPVLDIKPFLPSVDCPGSNTNRGHEKRLGMPGRSGNE